MLALVLLGCAAIGCSSVEPQPVALRVITYNVHGGGAIASTDAAKQALHVARQGRHMAEYIGAELAVLQPDVVALQEAVSAPFVARIARELNMHYAFFPGGARDPASRRPDGIPAAILTRFPILETQSCPLALAKTRPKDLFTRGYGKVVIDLAGETVAIFVAHLLPAWKHTTRIREGEIAEISACAERELARERSVIVLGDMNHRPAMPEYKLWAAGGFVDAVARKGWGEQFTSPSQSPAERIDYVFAAGPIAERLASATALTEGPWAIDVANEASFAISDHLPVLAVFDPRKAD